MTLDFLLNREYTYHMKIRKYLKKLDREEAEKTFLATESGVCKCGHLDQRHDMETQGCFTCHCKMYAEMNRFDFIQWKAKNDRRQAS